MLSAALDWLLAMPGIEAEHVVVFGQSLGGAVALNTIAASPHKEKLGCADRRGRLFRLPRNRGRKAREASG